MPGRRQAVRRKRRAATSSSDEWDAEEAEDVLASSPPAKRSSRRCVAANARTRNAQQAPRKGAPSPSSPSPKSSETQSAAPGKDVAQGSAIEKDVKQLSVAKRRAKGKTQTDSVAEGDDDTEEDSASEDDDEQSSSSSPAYSISSSSDSDWEEMTLKKVERKALYTSPQSEVRFMPMLPLNRVKKTDLCRSPGSTAGLKGAGDGGGGAMNAKSGDAGAGHTLSKGIATQVHRQPQATAYAGANQRRAPANVGAQRAPANVGAQRAQQTPAGRQKNQAKGRNPSLQSTSSTEKQTPIKDVSRQPATSAVKSGAPKKASSTVKSPRVEGKKQSLVAGRNSKDGSQTGSIAESDDKEVSDTSDEEKDEDEESSSCPSDVSSASDSDWEEAAAVVKKKKKVAAAAPTRLKRWVLEAEPGGVYMSWSAEERRIAALLAARHGLADVDYDTLCSKMESRSSKEVDVLAVSILSETPSFNTLERHAPIEQWKVVVQEILTKCRLKAAPCLPDAMRAFARDKFPAAGPGVPDYALIYKYLAAALASNVKLPILGSLEQAVVDHLVDGLHTELANYELDPLIGHLLETYNAPTLDKPIDAFNAELSKGLSLLNSSPVKHAASVQRPATPIRASAASTVSSRTAGTVLAAGTTSADAASGRNTAEARRCGNRPDPATGPTHIASSQEGEGADANAHQAEPSADTTVDKQLDEVHAPTEQQQQQPSEQQQTDQQQTEQQQQQQQQQDSSRTSCTTPKRQTVDPAQGHGRTETHATKCCPSTPLRRTDERIAASHVPAVNVGQSPSSGGGGGLTSDSAASRFSPRKLTTSPGSDRLLSSPSPIKSLHLNTVEFAQFRSISLQRMSSFCNPLNIPAALLNLKPNPNRPPKQLATGPAKEVDT
ncbi:uncharacterized protein LOC135823145 [Sycon ciliatum]|uniref:uncharacterized protein LOC135823145 n=1 Tax=Sycon ciliatum TaxID=27933 RepID=UPI0031F6737D